MKTVKIPNIFFLVFLWLGINIPHAGSSIDKKLKMQKNELQKIKQALEKEHNILSELMKTKKNVLDRINRTEDNMRLITHYLEKLNTTSKTLLSAKNEKSLLLEKARDKVVLSESAIAGRMRSLFIKGKPERIIIFGALRSGDDFFKRLYFMQKLIQADKLIMEEAIINRLALESAVTSLKKKLNEVETFKKFKIKEIRNYSIQMEKLKDNIIQIQQDEYLKRQAVEEMENNAIAMANIIKRLETERIRQLAQKKREKSLPKPKGPYCIPVKGKIVSRFGTYYHQRLKTSTQNLGIEYLGKSGGRVLSALAGRVVYRGNIPGYREGIIVVNNTGIYNIFGNLHHIKVHEGDLIKGCQDIAVIPKSPVDRNRRVYFEVRKEKVPLDPVKWLKSKIN